MTNLQPDEQQEDLMELDNTYWSEQKEALERLKNKDFFKKLIQEGYFKDYVFHLAMELIDPDVIASGRRNAVLEKLVGVAKLKDYFDTVTALSSSEEIYEEELVEQELQEKNRLAGINTALEKAKTDKDFELLIQECFVKDFANNQISLITNDAIIAGGHRSDVLESISGISTLVNYMIDMQKRYAEMQSVDNEIESSEEV